MSNLVLARKYRPRAFAEMAGQSHVVQALANALTSGRLHHAFLFTGTRGIGKTTVSRILAKSLNCVGPDGQGGITATPCGQCAACRAIDDGRFVDYTELDAASNRGVEEIQLLLEQAVYKPVQGRFKVFMIDEVHMLTNHAFNAMLKTLEEPPEYLKFVLATTDPQKVPVTVLSRCLQFNLRPMAPETVRAHLGTVLAAEGVAAEGTALALLARAARGSMRDALSLTDQAIAFGGGQVREADVRQMLGVTDRSVVFALVEALAEGDGARVVDTVDAVRVHGLSADAVLEDMSLLLQRMAVQQVLGGQGRDEAGDDAAELARLAALMPADETQLLYSICLHARGEIGYAPDEYAGLVMALLRLLAFKPAGTAEKKSPPDALSGPESTRPRGVVPAPVQAHQQAQAHQQGREPAQPPVARSTPPVLRVPVVETPPRRANDPSAASQANGTADTTAVAAPMLAVPVVVAGVGDGAATAPGAGVFEPVPDGDFWFEVVQALVAGGGLAGLARELALQAQMVGRDSAEAGAEHWLLRVEREALNHPGHRDRLCQALATLGHAVTIGVEVGKVTDSPSRRIARASAERLAAAEALILGDPFVQAMMRDFGATIVPGSVAPL